MFSFIKNLFKRKKATPSKREWERRIDNPSPVNRMVAGSGGRASNVINIHAADSYMPTQYDPLAITLANAAIEISSSYESSSCSDSSSYDSGSSDSSSSCSF